MYTVIRDTREKEGHGWRWRKSTACSGTVDGKIDTGDYTLMGYEHLLCLERKGRVSEWATNLTEKRFYRELDRMKEIPYAYILLEFHMEDLIKYPVDSGIPYKKQRYMKFKGRQVLAKTLEIMVKYPNIKIIFCGRKGKDVASSLFKRVVEHVKD